MTRYGGCHIVQISISCPQCEQINGSFPVLSIYLSRYLFCASIFIAPFTTFLTLDKASELNAFGGLLLYTLHGIVITPWTSDFRHIPFIIFLVKFGHPDSCINDCLVDQKLSSTDRTTVIVLLRRRTEWLFHCLPLQRSPSPFAHTYLF